MPLEKFIPLSPDPYITQDSDMKLAQFGHLNTIVDYLNIYVAADSLQLEGVGPLSATARYITDSAGNLSSLAISTGNIGIGTTAPIAPLNVYNSSASVSNLLLLEQDTSATVGQIINYRKNGSVNLVSGAEIGRLAFGGYFNSTYSPPSQTCSAIYGYYGGTGTDRVGGLRLVTWNGGGLTTRLQVAPDGKIGIGTTAATAKLEILGEGSTSATTSLKVQNSLGSVALNVNDAGEVCVGSNNTFGYRFLVSGNAYITTSVRIDGGLTVGANLTAVGQTQFTGGPTCVRDGNTFLVGGSPGLINTDVSALAEIRTTTKGFLKPRMTTAEKNLIATPAAGLEVFDTTLGRPCFYSGSAWVTL